jgi:hypothetical protein
MPRLHEKRLLEFKTARDKAAKAEAARCEAFRAELARAQAARAETAKAAAAKAESDEIAHENALGVKKRKQAQSSTIYRQKRRARATMDLKLSIRTSGGTRPIGAKRSAMLAIKPERSKKSVSLVKPTTLEKPRLPQQEELPCCSEERTQIEPNYGQAYHI